MMLNGNKTFGLCFGSGVLFPKGSKAHDLRIWKLNKLERKWETNLYDE